LVISLWAGNLLAWEKGLVPEAGNRYRIGPGDVLDISVWKNPDLTRVLTVLPDGTIRFPLIGELTAAGKHLEALSDELRARLERYVPEVDLSVIVAQVNSMVIYVIGRVKNPGRIAMNTPLNVMQALATAGGLNPFAKAKEIKVFRDKMPPPGYVTFNYEAVSQGKAASQNILLERGDVIVVP